MKVRYAILVMIVSTMLQGCAHDRGNQQLDAKVAAETAVKSRSDLGQEAKQRISEAPSLTADQKAKLLSLRESTAGQMDKLGNESLRLRSVLIEDLVAPNYDAHEVALIKKRIRSVEEKRVLTIFNATDQANQILGRDATKNQKILNDFFEDPHGHYN